MSTSPADPAQVVGPSTLITVKVLYDDNTRRFKVPLRDLNAHVLPQKLHQLLDAPSEDYVTFERYSDSAGCYVELDSDNQAVYKQLHRAAKAKLKLRLRATTVGAQQEQEQEQQEPARPESPARSTYLDSVPTQPTPQTCFDTLVADDAEAAALPSPPPSSSNTVEVTEKQEPSLPLAPHQSPTGLFCIDCNYCGRSIPNEHYHCSTCDDGDYDLCLQCVDSGVSCPGEGHWLIKRLVKDGIVTNSTTETIAPREFKPLVIKQEEPQSAAPSAPEPEPTPVSTCEKMSSPPANERICNACLSDFSESNMVTCLECADYDLCLSCLLNDSHGHHPAHKLSLIDKDRQFSLKSMVTLRCNPGRHFQHAAVCDGCDKRIVGVRNKCLTCPDWDYCTQCLQGAYASHAGHRFVPIYGSIAEPSLRQEVHYGIFCDGPLCKSQMAPSYISGVRYKCAVCHDTDFCGKCEASPSNVHNHTHPLIKFKTPVRRVTVTTANEDVPNGQAVTLGDRVQKRSTSTQANRDSLSSETLTPAASQPAETEKTPAQAQTVPTPSVRPTPTTARVVPVQDPVASYQAFFVRDTVPDGTSLAPNQAFRQTWTLYNPGPAAWPVGTDVRFVAGDTMFNVDTTRASSLQSVSAAMESNKLTAPLEPGQSTDFTVLLRSPDRAGSAISYWRLKLSNGVPFGHRLWCAINIKEPAEKAEETQEKQQPEQKEAEEEKEEPAVAQAEPEMTQSQMVFPTLDKESPVASTHENAPVIPTTAPEPSVSNYTDQDYLTITDTMSTEDDETRDGFLTDEEYDVLDASDQEYLEAKQAQ